MLSYVKILKSLYERRFASEGLALAPLAGRLSPDLGGGGLLGSRNDVRLGGLP